MSRRDKGDRPEKSALFKSGTHTTKIFETFTENDKKNIHQINYFIDRLHTDNIPANKKCVI